MNLTEIKAAIANLIGSQSASGEKVAALQNNITDLVQANSALEARLATAEATITASATEIATLKAEKAEFETKLAQASEGIAAKIDAEASKKALHIAASAGAPFVEEDAVKQQNGKKELLAEFNAITDGRKRAAFWSKHKDQLLG